MQSSTLASSMALLVALSVFAPASHAQQEVDPTLFPLAQTALDKPNRAAARPVRHVSSQHAQPVTAKKTAKPSKPAKHPDTAKIVANR